MEGSEVTASGGAPSYDAPSTNGSWSDYPFFESGTLAVTSKREGRECSWSGWRARTVTARAIASSRWSRCSARR